VLKRIDRSREEKGVLATYHQLSSKCAKEKIASMGKQAN
jgi:hypothetical protein